MNLFTCKSVTEYHGARSRSQQVELHLTILELEIRRAKQKLKKVYRVPAVNRLVKTCKVGSSGLIYFAWNPVYWVPAVKGLSDENGQQQLLLCIIRQINFTGIQVLSAAVQGSHRRRKRGYAVGLIPQLFMWGILACIST